MNQYDGLLLASGGMDSTVLAYMLEKENKNVLILFINYGATLCKKRNVYFTKGNTEKIQKQY